ncbi:MAG: Bpu10I family restriction endonuclease [Treponema sp.]|jgi:hypothetical protein|nr:Bpu10I family restriction endonuclease [Treponema sp.]
MIIPAIHGDKLQALLRNNKLPKSDRQKVHEAIERYNFWRSSLLGLFGTQTDIITQAVKLLNDYKNHIELDLIFSSHEDFLYRQKGQLKLDNTVLEEFLPLLVYCIFRDSIDEKNIMLGPMACISGIRFDSSLSIEAQGGGIILKQKDQDFAISRRLFLKASHYESFEKSVIKETNIAFLACECKTNLDKTMFQEASATALDLKSSVPTAKYLLLCEWLDMTPINSSTTAIDEIIILRKAKRIGSSERQNYSSSNERLMKSDSYKNFINSHPYAVDTFTRFIEHINELLEDVKENEILNRGYF